MQDLVHYTHCPVCGSQAIQPSLLVKDHSVSGESFRLVDCLQCRLRFTQDIPTADTISPYYKTENYISHTNTSRGLVNLVYQQVRKRTLRQKRKLVERVTGLKSGTLLDMGSGVGSFVNEMRSNGWKATGMEPDADARKVAKSTYGVDLSDTANFYDLEQESFDAITLWHVLEHVHELSAYMAQLKKLLRPSGRIIIAVPNYTSGDAGQYGEYWAAYDVPRHLYHFSPFAMETLVQSHGLRLVEKQPMWYDSYYISLLSSRYKSGNTEWLGAMLSGWRSNRAARKNPDRCSSITYIIGK